MSAGRFTVTGKVFGWVQVPEPKQTYVGPSGCNGICRNARLGELLVAALTASDPQIDFSRFDNDGPDNVPNSGDDDGFVDFVAFVQPDVGGECALPANDNIWSHRYSLMSWNNDNYQTQDTGKAGARILIDDYVIVPALDCDGRTMIQIGVFSHEFGHAFGLPDLYDSNAPAESEGIGGWGLMGAGSWGGDGKNTPHIPTHMEAWSKEFLGWVTPRVIEADEQGVELRPVESSGDVVRVDYSDAADPEDKKYLLLEYRAKTGFDRSLTAAGLLVTEINNASVQSGLVNNSVNGDPSVFGVNVIEADGKRDLDTLQNRGDQGDVFPGGMNVQKADAGHPESLSAALCNIRQSNDRIVLDVYVSRTICPGALSGAAISPVEAQNNAIIGQEVVVEGVLKNVGSNYFTDRRIVIEGVEPNGGQLAVSPPAVLESLGPNAPNQLDDLLGKTIILRGHLERSVLKGRGQSDVLIVDEYQIAE
jgi:M6 family metalloprotease-like protein